MKFLITLMVALASFQAQAAEPPQKLRVVASFSILGDMVKNIAGDAVDLKVLVGPDADTHVYEPTPADAKTLANADLIIVNGLGFEGWMDRLIASSGFKGKQVIATSGIGSIAMGEDDDEDEDYDDDEDDEHEHKHHHGVDPHAWQSASNGIIYAQNIRNGLMHANIKNGMLYKKNAEAYIASLKTLDSWVKAEIAKVPAGKRKVITSHDAFGHFAHAYGVEFLSPVGVSTESEATASDVAKLIDQLRGGSVKAVFLENISDPRLAKQIAKEGGGYLGGALYSDALSKPGKPAGSYVKMFDNNVKLLVAGMLHNQ